MLYIRNHYTIPRENQNLRVEMFVTRAKDSHSYY